jgi:hypothetical protein
LLGQRVIGPRRRPPLPSGQEETTRPFRTLRPPRRPSFLPTHPKAQTHTHISRPCPSTRERSVLGRCECPASLPGCDGAWAKPVGVPRHRPLSLSLSPSLLPDHHLQGSVPSPPSSNVSSARSADLACRLWPPRPAAIAWEAAKPLSIEEVEVAPPKKGEVRIKILLCVRAPFPFPCLPHADLTN